MKESAVITERDLESVCSIVNCLCRITTDYILLQKFHGRQAWYLSTRGTRVSTAQRVWYGVVKTGAQIDFANTGAFSVPGKTGL